MGYSLLRPEGWMILFQRLIFHHQVVWNLHIRSNDLTLMVRDL